MLSVSLGHGFPQGDVPEHGTRVLVVTDDAKPNGDALAGEFGERCAPARHLAPAGADHRRGDRCRLCGAERAGRDRGRRRQCRRRRGLRQHHLHPPAVLERGLQDAAVGPVWDPIAVEPSRRRRRRHARLAHRRQDRGHFRAPIDGEATVLGLCHDGRQTFGQTMVAFGDGAGIRIGGVDIALIAHRTQALGTEIFTASGIDLASNKYVGVKSTNHFHAAYAPIAGQVLYCDGDGPSPIDTRKYPFTKARRTIWPHVELPEGIVVAVFRGCGAALSGAAPSGRAARIRGFILCFNLSADMP